jgi:hypothetical protein
MSEKYKGQNGGGGVQEWGIKTDQIGKATQKFDVSMLVF